MPDSPEQREHDRLVRGGRYSPLLEEVEGLRARVAELEAERDAALETARGAKALARIHRGTSQRLAADLERVQSRIPVGESGNRDGMDVCASCGLHPFDYTVAEFDAETDRERERAERAEARAGSLEEALREARDALQVIAGAGQLDAPTASWMRDAAKSTLESDRLRAALPDEQGARVGTLHLGEARAALAAPRKDGT